MDNIFKKLRKRLERIRKGHFLGPLEKSRRSKGEMPKCKTCMFFSDYYKVDNPVCYNNPLGKTMKMACENYKRKQKTIQP